MQPTYKYIFIDLDDTLWDFHTNAKSALHDIFYEVKLNEMYADFENFYRIYATRNLELWTQYGKGEITKEYLVMERFLSVLVAIGINDKELALKINTRYLDILGSKTTLIPNSIELLELCVENNLPVTLVTNGFTQVQTQKIKNAKIDHYFSHIVLSDTAGALKPESAFFKYALDLNNAKPKEVLMIGDNYDADIMGAVNAGIDALYLNHTGRIEELPKNVIEIKSLNEAIEFLETKLSTSQHS